MKTNSTIKMAILAGTAVVATAAVATFGLSYKNVGVTAASHELYLDMATQTSYRMTALSTVNRIGPSTTADAQNDILCQVTSDLTVYAFSGSNTKLAYAFCNYMRSTVGSSIITQTYYFSVNGLTSFFANSYEGSASSTTTMAGVTMSYAFYSGSIDGTLGTAVASGSYTSGNTISTSGSVRTVAIILKDALTSNGSFGFGLLNLKLNWAC